MVCCIYVIGGESGAVKVGIAESPERRLADLQMGSPVRLRVLYAGEMSCRRIARRAEALAHHYLKAHREHGEWFNVEALAAVNVIILAAHMRNSRLRHLIDPRTLPQPRTGRLRPPRRFERRL